MLTLDDNALSEKEKWDVVLERARWSVQLGALLNEKKNNQWIKCKAGGDGCGLSCIGGSHHLHPKEWVYFSSFWWDGFVAHRMPLSCGLDAGLYCLSMIRNKYYVNKKTLLILLNK